jgi:hypothetical protein
MIEPEKLAYVRCVRRLILFVCLLATLVPAAALADTSVLPDPSTGLPWVDPAHHSALEVFADNVASHIAGRPVTITCNGDNDWGIFAQQQGFNPSIELGFVPIGYYWTATRTLVSNSDQMFLGPTVCLALQQFGFAMTKPTKCQPTVTKTTTTFVKRRYSAAVWKVVNGKRVKRFVWRTRRVPKTTTTSSLGPLAPCYKSGGTALAQEDPTYWTTYRAHAQALWALAHESIHNQQLVAGAPIDTVIPASETDANCYGLQWIPWVAEQFGATTDDAQAIAEFAYETMYTGYQGVMNNGSPYWSADCRANGSLDLTPGDNLWP